MPGLDQQLAGLGTGASLVLALAVALLLGLRHATDPDHLTALSTLVLTDEDRSARRAGRLGLAWGAGHATTLVVLGLPVVLLNRLLPDDVQRGAEAAVGVVIVVLALRLLDRWRRGCFHTHPHEHGGVAHVHPHVHVHAHDDHARAHAAAHAHDHQHAEALGRSPAAAFGIGLVHGAGGSGGVGVLLIGAMPGHAVAAAALVLFAAATALSMALVSAAWGGALATGPVARRMVALAPVFGAVSLLFGVWYGTGALA